MYYKSRKNDSPIRRIQSTGLDKPKSTAWRRRGDLNERTFLFVQYNNVSRTNQFSVYRSRNYILIVLRYFQHARFLSAVRTHYIPSCCTKRPKLHLIKTQSIYSGKTNAGQEAADSCDALRTTAKNLNHRATT